MPAYYNEFDPGAAAWLRELIKRGLIADGEVDDRSIVDVQGADLRGFTQCHFFAGIGGWSYALRLAGWSDDRPVWTGSPPCQPFSNAGRQIGKGDDRHLAPHFADLVADVRPPVIFGEQVASAAVFGRSAKRAGGAADGEPDWTWIDDLFGRLEAAHYACGAVDLPAACVGAPHIRQRTFFGAVRLADADGQHVWRGLGQGNGTSGEAEGEARQRQRGGDDHRLGGADERLADADAAIKGMVGNGSGSMDGRGSRDAWLGHRSSSSDGRLADADSGQRNGIADGKKRLANGAQAGWKQGNGEPERGRSSSGLADAIFAGLEGQPRNGDNGDEPGRLGAVAAGSIATSGELGGLADTDREAASRRRVQRPGQSDGEGYGSARERPAGLCADGGTYPTNGHWRDADWLFCRDGKWRPVEPGASPLAHGLPARVVRLRGFGNAIVPQVAAEFIGAMMEVIG